MISDEELTQLAEYLRQTYIDTGEDFVGLLKARRALLEYREMRRAHKWHPIEEAPEPDVMKRYQMWRIVRDRVSFRDVFYYNGIWYRDGAGWEYSLREMIAEGYTHYRELMGDGPGETECR